jgi:hypothetical protein
MLNDVRNKIKVHAVKNNKKEKNQVKSDDIPNAQACMKSSNFISPNKCAKYSRTLHMENSNIQEPCI